MKKYILILILSLFSLKSFIYCSEVQVQEIDYQTEFMQAVMKNNHERVKELLDIEIDNKLVVDLNAIRIDGNIIPLSYAAQQGYKEIVELLLKHVKNEKDINEALIYSAYSGNYNVNKPYIASLLLNAGAQINYQDDQYHKTVLHTAVHNFYVYEKQRVYFEDLINFLLKNKADINIKDRSNETALWIAVRHTLVNIVESLLKYGSDVNGKNIDEDSLLKLATIVGIFDSDTSKCDRLHVIELLLQYGADISSAKNAAGPTALDLALSYNLKNEIALLTRWQNYKNEYLEYLKANPKNILNTELHRIGIPSVIHQIIYSYYENLNFIDWMKYVHPEAFVKTQQEEENQKLKRQKLF